MRPRDYRDSGLSVENYYIVHVDDLDFRFEVGSDAMCFAQSVESHDANADDCKITIEFKTSRREVVVSNS